MAVHTHPHPHANPNTRHAFSVAVGVLAVIVAAAMTMVFVVLVADIVQHVLGVAVTPAVRTARGAFWWVLTNRNLPP